MTVTDLTTGEPAWARQLPELLAHRLLPLAVNLRRRFDTLRRRQRVSNYCWSLRKSERRGKK